METVEFVFQEMEGVTLEDWGQAATATSHRSKRVLFGHVLPMPGHTFVAMIKFDNDGVKGFGAFPLAEDNEASLVGSNGWGFFRGSKYNHGVETKDDSIEFVGKTVALELKWFALSAKLTLAIEGQPSVTFDVSHDAVPCVVLKNSKAMILHSRLDVNQEARFDALERAVKDMKEEMKQLRLSNASCKRRILELEEEVKDKCQSSEAAEIRRALETLIAGLPAARQKAEVEAQASRIDETVDLMLKETKELDAKLAELQLHEPLPLPPGGGSLDEQLRCLQKSFDSATRLLARLQLRSFEQTRVGLVEIQPAEPLVEPGADQGVPCIGSCAAEAPNS